MAPVKPAGKSSTAINGHWTRRNHRHCLFRHVPTAGRALGPVDVGDEHEMPIVQIRVLSHRWLLGGGDLVGVVGLPCAAGELNGLSPGAESQGQNDGKNDNYLRMIPE
jgi:hypothetical protein